MTSWQKWSPYALSLLRIVAALLFIEHGLQKYIGFPSAGPPMSTMLWIQGAIEIVGGVLLLVGAWTRPIAVILCGDMAAASSPISPARSFRR
jgi:putative oxidoreductase